MLWWIVQIAMAHAMWSKLGSSSYDYNFTFLTPTTTALFDMLPKEEKLLLKASFHPSLSIPAFATPQSHTLNTR